MALLDALEKMVLSAKMKNWDKVYIAVDIHDVIVYGNYKSDELPTTFLKGAKETLQLLTKREDVCLIIFSCSHYDELIKYDLFFKENDIVFDYINENPEVPDTALGCYKDKFYFNIYLEDKAGFIESDWSIVNNMFSILEPLNK